MRRCELHRYQLDELIIRLRRRHLKYLLNLRLLVIAELLGLAHRHHGLHVGLEDGFTLGKLQVLYWGGLGLVGGHGCYGLLCCDDLLCLQSWLAADAIVANCSAGGCFCNVDRLKDTLRFAVLLLGGGLGLLWGRALDLHALLWR